MPSHTYSFFMLAKEMWDAVYEACLRAESSILFENFILRDDATGRRFIELFKVKARQGVAVTVLLDAVGSSQFLQTHLDRELGEEGIELVFFNSIIPGMLSHYTPWYFRNHRKLIVIDSKTAFTGGVCFQEHMADWRDTGVRIEGPVVRDMEMAFWGMWRYAKKEGDLTHDRKYFDADRRFLFLTNLPLRKKRSLTEELILRIRKAKRSIVLTSPYFAPTLGLMRALRAAARRGVEVELLLPLRSDNTLVDIASWSYFDALLRKGVKIWRHRSPMNHTKAGVIDGDWAMLGSLNLDHASLRYNFEGSLVTNDEAFAGAIREQFAADRTNAELLTLGAWRGRSWNDRVLEYLVRPLRLLA